MGCGGNALRALRDNKMMPAYVFEHVFGLLLLILAFILSDLMSAYDRELKNAPETVFMRPTKEGVPDAFAGVYCLLLPYLMVLLITRSPRISAAFITACGNTMLIAVIVKKMAGELRPFISSFDEAAQTGQARESFPSGHASSSTMGYTFLSLVLHALFFKGDFAVAPRLHRAVTAAPGFFASVTLVPLLFALMVMVTRLREGRHSLTDLAAGALLGTFISFYTFKCYFKSERNCCSSCPYAVSGRNKGVKDCCSGGDSVAVAPLNINNSACGLDTQSLGKNDSGKNRYGVV